MPTVSVSYDGEIATVLIDQPERRNSLTLEMWQQVPRLLDDLAADAAVKVVVFRGAGEHFSAGADIRDIDRILFDPDLGDGAWVTYAEEAIASFAKPTIAAIDGFCVGGGWEIAGACDLRIATDRATFGITASRIGIVYPASGISRLVRIAGEATARYLLYTGDIVDAATALRMGLLTTLVAPSALDDEVASVARRLAVRSQLSIHSMKRLIGEIAAGGGRLDDEVSAWRQELEKSDDPAIGAAAFIAGSRPEFTWRGAAS
jgi:enoyl-CoA hydratase/carnithine racemase